MLVNTEFCAWKSVPARFQGNKMIKLRERNQSHQSCSAVNYTLIGVEPHRPTRGVWPIAVVTNHSQLHLVASSI